MAFRGKLASVRGLEAAELTPDIQHLGNPAGARDKGHMSACDTPALHIP